MIVLFFNYTKFFYASDWIDVFEYKNDMKIEDEIGLGYILTESKSCPLEIYLHFHFNSE